jgi:hypothetical protein
LPEAYLAGPLMAPPVLRIPLRRFSSAVPADAEAPRVIVLNESLSDLYRWRYGVDSGVVRAYIDDSECEWESSGEWPNSDAEPSVIFTGSAYEAHYDAFRNLKQAAPSLDRENMSCIFTRRYQRQSSSVRIFAAR